MKGLEGREKLEKKALRRPHASRYGEQGRRQQKSHKGVNKQEGHRKPRRGPNRAGEGMNTGHPAQPAHKTQRNRHPGLPHTIQGTRPQKGDRGRLMETTHEEAANTAEK